MRFRISQRRDVPRFALRDRISLSLPLPIYRNFLKASSAPKAPRIPRDVERTGSLVRLVTQRVPSSLFEAALSVNDVHNLPN